MPSAPTVFVDTNVLVYADDGREPAEEAPFGGVAFGARTLGELQTALEARFALSWWDALMVAAGLHQGCEMLLTEDLQHDQRIDNLRIVNPFRVGPELLDEPA